MAELGLNPTVEAAWVPSLHSAEKRPKEMGVGRVLGGGKPLDTSSRSTCLLSCAPRVPGTRQCPASSRCSVNIYIMKGEA